MKNEAYGIWNSKIFQGFCINRFSIGPLHYISSCSDFGFEFAEIFVKEKQLADLVTRQFSESLTLQIGELVSRRLSESAIECSKENSPLHRVGESLMPQLGKSGSRRLSDLLSQGVGDSPTRRFEESLWWVGESLQNFFNLSSIYRTSNS